MRLGISGQALGGVRRFQEIVRLGLKYGVRDFELWPVNAPGEGPGYAGRDVSEVARIAEGEGIGICCVTLGAAFDPEATKDAAGYARLLCEALDAAKALGAPVVNHYCYYISLGEEHDFARMERYWAQPIAHAHELGVRLALENEAHDGTRTPESMLAVIKHFADPYFLTNYDAVNYLHAGCEGFPAAYEILKPYIGYVHLKNGCLYRPGAGQPTAHRGAPMSGHLNPLPIQYAPIPDGSVNITGLLTRLVDDGAYRGVCTLEPHTKPEFVGAFYDRESRWLRSLGFFID